jgi:hypothetical protein
LIVRGERGMKRDEIPEHLGGDITLWQRTGSAQVTELVVHHRIEWFEVGGQGCRERVGCKEGEQKEERGRHRVSCMAVPNTTAPARWGSSSRVRGG